MQWAVDWLLHFSRDIHLLRFNLEKSQGGHIHSNLQLGM